MSVWLAIYVSLAIYRSANMILEEATLSLVFNRNTYNEPQFIIIEFVAV